MPKVTVLTATYNRPGFLGDAIESVVNQSFMDWEMIIINDGGEDVRDIVEDFKDNRIKYFSRRKNRGKAACLNFGLKKAAGEYIAYIDDDDLWYPNHLEVLSGSLDKHEDIGAVYSDLYAVQFIQDEKNGKRYPLHKMIQVARDYNRDFMFHFNHTLHVSFMHRKDLAIRAGGYDENVTVLIDWNITRKLSFYTDFKYVPILTGEYYIPIWKSDRISNLEREDDEKFKHNLRKIKADLPPEPWPKVDRIGVIFPVYDWTDSVREMITNLVDKICYPAKFILVNNDAGSSEIDCRISLGKIGELKNIFILTPQKPLMELEAYRFGAEEIEADYVYLPTKNADVKLELRMIFAMDYLKKTECDGAKWDIEQERKGAFDIIIKREKFLQVSDDKKGEMETVVGVVPKTVPESLTCDFFANIADKQHKNGNYKIAFQCAQMAMSAKKGWVGDQYLIDTYSKICFDLKKYDEAEEKCRILIERGYGADNWIRLGQILQTKEKYDDAIEAYRKGLEEINLSEADLDSPIFPIFIKNDFGSFIALLGMGECMFETGNLTGASGMFRRAAKLKANSPRPFLGFGSVFLKTGQLDKAEEAVASAKIRNDKDPKVYRLLGELHRKKRKLSKAFRCYQKALSLEETNPENVEPIYRLGAALEKWEDMKDIFEEFLKHRPAHIPSIKHLSSIYCELGDYQQAEALIERGLIFDQADSELNDRYEKIKQIKNMEGRQENISANGELLPTLGGDFR